MKEKFTLAIPKRGKFDDTSHVCLRAVVEVSSAEMQHGILADYTPRHDSIRRGMELKLMEVGCESIHHMAYKVKFGTETYTWAGEKVWAGVFKVGDVLDQVTNRLNWYECKLHTDAPDALLQSWRYVVDGEVFEVKF